MTSSLPVPPKPKLRLSFVAVGFLVTMDIALSAGAFWHYLRFNYQKQDPFGGAHAVIVCGGGCRYAFPDPTALDSQSSVRCLCGSPSQKRETPKRTTVWLVSEAPAFVVGLAMFGAWLRYEKWRLMNIWRMRQ